MGPGPVHADQLEGVPPQDQSPFDCATTHEAFQGVGGQIPAHPCHGHAAQHLCPTLRLDGAEDRVRWRFNRKYRKYR